MEQSFKKIEDINFISRKTTFEIHDAILACTNSVLVTYVNIDLTDNEFNKYVILIVSNKSDGIIFTTYVDNESIVISPNNYRIFKRVSWTPECWNYSPEI